MKEVGPATLVASVCTVSNARRLTTSSPNRPTTQSLGCFRMGPQVSCPAFACVQTTPPFSKPSTPKSSR